MIKNDDAKEFSESTMLVLEMLLEENIYSHILVRDVLNKYNYLSQQEKSFIKRVYEGTLERRIELDYIISQYAKNKNLIK